VLDIMIFEGWWGWIPNISGDTFSSSYIKQQIEKKNKRNDSNNSFIFTDANTVTASAQMGTAYITIRDEGGMCSVKAESNVEDEKSIWVWLNRIWSEFIDILVSSSGGECTAVNKLIKADEHTIEKKIVNVFMDSMEYTSDAGGYIEKDVRDLGDWEGRMEKARLQCNNIRINHLYGMRFLDIYGGKFADERIELEKKMEFRYKKAEIVYEAVMHTAEMQFRKLLVKADHELILGNRRSIWFAVAFAGISVVATVAVGLVTVMLI